MNVIDVNEGTKIVYVVDGNKITFADELMLNLEKLERDFDVSIDICIDKYGMITTGLGVKYAAQIEIPARQYTEASESNPDYDENDEASQEFAIVQEAAAFNMDNVTLKLYAI